MIQERIQQAIENEDYMQAAVLRSSIDPDWFCNEILRMPNDPWQSHGMEVIADLKRLEYGLPTKYNHKGKNRISIVAYHGPGKTHFMGKAGHWWNFIQKGRIPCTAPKLDQLKTRLWPEMRKITSNAIPLYRDLIKIDRTMIRWCGDEDWCMIAESASQPENLAGYHDEHLLFLVEEASGVDEIMWPVIEGALSTPGAVLVIIGNPTKTTGEFWASHNKRGTKELYYQIAITPEDSPRISKDWVDGMIRKYGIHSPIVKCRVLGQFVDMEEGQLLDPNWLEAVRLETEKEEDGSIPTLVISGDIADGGIDESVYHVAKHYHSYKIGIKQVRKSYTSETAVIDAADDLEQLFIDYEGDKGRDYFVIDSLGVGAGTAQELIRRGYRVIKYKGGQQSDQPKMWRNRRVQSYMVLRDQTRDQIYWFAPDFCDDDDWEDFLAQACSIKYKDSGDKLEDLMTKNDMKAKGLKSPDMTDSWAMQFATSTPINNSQFEIETFGELESHVRQS